MDSQDIFVGKDVSLLQRVLAAFCMRINVGTYLESIPEVNQD